MRVRGTYGHEDTEVDRNRCAPFRNWFPGESDPGGEPRVAAEEGGEGVGRHPQEAVQQAQRSSTG